MEKGIMICGLNGSGKARWAALWLSPWGISSLTMRICSFQKQIPTICLPLRVPVRRLSASLQRLCQAHPNFVFSAVRGDYGEVVPKLYRCVIRVEVPKEIRLQRVQRRSYEKFGARMLPGGDLHVQESAFFAMVADRTEQYVAQWVATLHCPVLRVDGTRPVAENVAFIRQELRV